MLLMSQKFLLEKSEALLKEMHRLMQKSKGR